MGAGSRGGAGLKMAAGKRDGTKPRWETMDRMEAGRKGGQYGEQEPWGGLWRETATVTPPRPDTLGSGNPQAALGVDL